MEVKHKVNVPFRRSGEICSVCKKKENKFKCPECSVFYCSGGCFKAHNEHCTEKFFKSCVKQELKTIKTGKEDRKKFNRIMERLNEKEFVPEIITEHQEKQLNLILENIKDPSVYSLLSEHQKASFNEFLHGNSGELVTEWVPWWEEDAENPDIQDTSNEYTRYNGLPSCPSPAVNPVLPYYISRLLWAMAYVWRIYNGDEANIEEMAYLLDDISNFRRSNKELYEDMQSALVGPVNKAYKLDYKLTCNIHVGIYHDLYRILSKGHILTALFKLYDFFAYLPITSFHTKQRFSEIYKKKLLFLLCYVKSKPSNLFKRYKEEAFQLYEQNTHS